MIVFIDVFKDLPKLCLWAAKFFVSDDGNSDYLEVEFKFFLVGPVTLALNEQLRLLGVVFRDTASLFILSIFLCFLSEMTSNKGVYKDILSS